MKFSSFHSLIFILSARIVVCPQNISFEVKIAKRATEIPTRNGYDIGDRLESNKSKLPEKERKPLCEKAMEAVQRNTSTNRIQFHNEKEATKYYGMKQKNLYRIGEMKTYLFIMNEKINIGGVERWTTSLALLPAFMCETVPELYIHLSDDEEKSKPKKLFAIVRDRSFYPSLNNTKSILIHFAEEIREVYSDEIELPLSSSSLYYTSFNTDEFWEDERLRLCQKARQVVPSLSATYEKEARTDRSKYYSMKLLEQSMSREIADPADSSAIEENDVIVEAFRCPYDPDEVYIHFSDEGRNGYTFCIIVKRNEMPAVAFNIVAYLVRSTEIVEEAPLEMNVGKGSFRVTAAKSVIDFDTLQPEKRREMCRIAINTFFGSAVTLVEDDEIGPSKFYYMKPSVITTDAAIQAMYCPTDGSSPVYIHVTKRKDGGNIMWIIVSSVYDFSSLLNLET